MSLKKSLELKSGYTADYWRIAYLGIDPINRELTIDANCYKSKAAYVADAEPIYKANASLTKKQLNALPLNILVTVKPWLATGDEILKLILPQLTGAITDPTDVIS